MMTVATQDVNIAAAIKAGTLEVVECWSERLEETYWAIKDERGTIEVQGTEAQCWDRVDEVKDRMRVGPDYVNRGPLL